MWGDYELLHFYPRNWQVGYFRSGHSLLVYITMWQYWLWFTFIFLLNIYFVFLFRALTYRRADIRGRRAVGDRRRSAWPEMFTCFFPFLWCINILNNSLGILKVVEADGDYAALTIQVIGFQWGWSYGYGELNYTRLLLAPIRVGFGLVLRPGYTLAENINAVEVDEIEMCRAWLKSHDALVPFTAGPIKLPMFQFGVWTTVQGTSSSAFMQKYNLGGTLSLVGDPLRLLRATEVIAVPTRSNIRILATAQDVTHSWALPALGLKLDCVPGRLYVSFLNIVREGVYYGQCSELCGWNHYNMPIVLYALAYEHFVIWWELELHTIFCKQSRDSALSYRTLNFKYK